VLRFAFWSLLLLNAALFAYAQGYFDANRGAEPVRPKPELNTGRLMLLTRAQAEAAARAAPAPEVAPDPLTPADPPAPQALACVDAGPFAQAEARRFESSLVPLALGARLVRQTTPSQDVTSWLVHIPPQGSKEAADRKAAELRALGVTNFFIMNGDSPLKWAISLGVFKTETGAQALLAQLNKQGVHTARITPRGPQTTRYTYRLRDLDAETRAKVAAIVQPFEDAEVKDCR